MVPIIVFYLLMVSNVNIVWTTVFPPEYLQMMTPEEMLETFGTDEIPTYQILSVVLPGTNRSQNNDEIHLTVQIDFDDTETNLIFKRTTRYLARRSTPVWLAVTNHEAHNNIRYDPLPNAMEDIGEFKTYHDTNNDAAIVVYTDPEHGAIIEGIVTADYAIKSLPKRLINQTLITGGNHFSETSLHRKRSIATDADEVTVYSVLFKSSHPASNATRNVYRNIEKRQSHSTEHYPSRLSAVYPEILLVLDHNAIRHHTITEALRFMIAFWNAVDMVYSRLDNPKVYLNIAGIIISADDAATPYIASNTSIIMKPDNRDILSGLREYFGKELDRFPFTQYDMIMAMTTITLCETEIVECDIVLGRSTFGHACTPTEARLGKIIWPVGVVHYNWMFSGVATMVHESAHFFGVDHDEGKDATANCKDYEGYAMSPTGVFKHQSLKWSPCSEEYFQDFFNSTRSQCLENIPTWTKSVKEVLPGRWLSLDGQCQNTGSKKWCQVAQMVYTLNINGQCEKQFPDFSICHLMGCEAKNSSECKISGKVPLQGTRCGMKKICKNSECVHE